MKKLFAIILCVGLAGCATMPSQKEVATLDYGAPVTVDYEKAIKQYFSTVLVDPYSAVYEFGTPPFRTYWFKDIPLAGGKMYVGYLVPVTINAKNRMGGYAGRENYGVIFRNNEIIRVITLDHRGQPTESILHSK